MSLRQDQEVIAELIEPGTKVIDIGCGGGELLAALEENKGVTGHGLEIASEKVSTALASGISAIQGDGDTDLQYYPDKSFDYAILGQTLQIMRHPKMVLQDALRIAKKVIVVIPNFGHFKNRIYLATRGRMPVTSKLSYQWHETPNIHFCTIKDFIVLAEEIGCKIEKKLYMDGKGKTRPFSGNGSLHANLFGDFGIFVLSKY